METRVINNDNPWYRTTKGGNDTNDKIFLLSIEEVVKYFGDSDDLKNRKGWDQEVTGLVLKDRKGYWINDQYNNARITKDISGTASWWWLRSPGRGNGYAAGVYHDGSLIVGGCFVYNHTGGVRPALYLNL